MHCLYDEIADAAALKLWSEQPGSKNPQLHPAKQLDRYETVVAGNGYRRCAVVSTLSGCVTKGNGLVMMARRRGWKVPIERQAYANRAEEIRDVAADNRIAEMAEHDDAALRQLLGELDPGELPLAAVTQEELAGLIAKLDPAAAKLTPVVIQPTPKLAWVLIGIPLVDFGKINTHIEAIAALPGTIVENTLGSEPEPDPAAASPRK